MADVSDTPLQMQTNGATIEARRLGLGVSRDELGAKAGGVNPSTIWSLERERRRPHRSTLAAIVRALDELENSDGPGGTGPSDGTRTTNEVVASAYPG